MCESEVIVKGKPKQVIKDVIKVIVSGKVIVCSRIADEEIKLKGRIKEIDLLNHRIVVE
jgi:predicted RNA-binding protein